MGKVWAIISKLGTITSKSITVDDAKKAVEELDTNDDGKISFYDLVIKVIEKVK